MSRLIIINGDEEFLKERKAYEEARSSLNESSKYVFPNDEEKYLEDSAFLSLDGSSRTFLIWNCSKVPVLPENDSDFLVLISKPKTPIKDERAIKVWNFPALKAYDDKNEYIPWIIQEGENHNIDLKRIANALFVSCGKSLRKISNEIQKLSILTSSGTISTDIAKQVICFSSDITPKSIVDAVCEGNVIKAMAFLEKLQENQDETGWIISYMQRHILQQLQIEFLNSPESKILDPADVIGMHPYVYKKLLDINLGLWNKNSLLESYHTLCDIDLLHKSGDVSSKLLLELEVIRLSEEAKLNVRSRRV